MSDPEAKLSIPKKPKSKPKSMPAAQTQDGPRELVDALRAAGAGDYSTRVDVSAWPPDLATIGTALNETLDRIGREQKIEGHRRDTTRGHLQTAREHLTGFVQRGELDVVRFNPTDDAVVDPLLEGLNQVFATLHTFVREINEASLRLSSSANEVLASSTQHESSSTEQAAAIHETTATMEELKHASAQIAENAGSVARVAEETLNSARSGRGAIGEFIHAMQQIRADGTAVSESITKLLRRVERIGTVVEVIDEIADRSDLLALNAALEGSRAGEAGKGFSIVAAEMRRLAENVLESTKEIKNLITEIREATAAAANAADASRVATEQGEKLGSVAAGSIEGILSGVQETSDAARVINLATQQQRTATEQVVASMGEIEDVTRQTTQASKQATGAAAELTGLANRLSDLIRRFKVA
jgi:methyl-accepting chemotaxis protein